MASPNVLDYVKAGAQDWYANGIGRMLDNSGMPPDPNANTKALFAREPATFEGRFAPALAQPVGSMAPTPLPQPDPRGPPVSIGSPTVAQPTTQNAPTLSDHVLAALRAVFEGEKYRQNLPAGSRDSSGLYDMPAPTGN